ncbi:RacP protein [Streptomyces sp. NPDC020607]|uniref:RacP protein n=1 Tax=Streptomyces sp. NPDC020607 TaxID=3365082 RepID=UPI0037B12200
MPRRSGPGRRKGDAARRHAECICRILMEARPAGLHTPQLLAACELSRCQAEAGLAMLREIITEMNWPPLIWTRVDGYQFTVDGDELERYEVAWVRVKVTEVRRFITATLAPNARLDPTDKRVRHIVTHLASVEATLDLIA